MDVVSGSEESIFKYLNPTFLLMPAGGDSSCCKKKTNCIEVYEKITPLLT